MFKNFNTEFEHQDSHINHDYIYYQKNINIGSNMEQINDFYQHTDEYLYPRICQINTKQTCMTVHTLKPAVYINFFFFIFGTLYHLFNINFQMF